MLLRRPYIRKTIGGNRPETGPNGVYATDFSEYAIGSQPEDWSRMYNANGVFSVNENGNLLMDTSASGDSRLVWNKVGSPSDAEILVKCRSVGSKEYMYVSLREQADGNNTSDGYIGYYSPFVDNGMAMGFYNADSFSYIGGSGTGETWRADTWRFLRMRAEGQNFKIKSWKAGSGEPTGWDIEGTDDTFSAGKVGIGGHDGGQVEFGYVGVGTKGKKAPAPGLR